MTAKTLAIIGASLLTVAGNELAGVHHLRTVADATALRDVIRGAARVVVIGAGWIGSELTASARQVGAAHDPAGLADVDVRLTQVRGSAV